MWTLPLNSRSGKTILYSWSEVKWSKRSENNKKGKKEEKKGYRTNEKITEYYLYL